MHRTTKRRFFTPDINSWKYNNVPAKPKKHNLLKINNNRLDKIIDNSTELVDFAISFTKTVVKVSFVLFVIINAFILIMLSINYINSGELLYIDSLITESYGMLRDVIAAYIIKAATENALRIGFSVLSDYLDKKYDIKIKDEEDEFEIDDNDYIDNIDPMDDEDPMNAEEETENSEIKPENGGIDYIVIKK